MSVTFSKAQPAARSQENTNVARVCRVLGKIANFASDFEKRCYKLTMTVERLCCSIRDHYTKTRHSTDIKNSLKQVANVSSEQEQGIPLPPLARLEDVAPLAKTGISSGSMPFADLEVVHQLNPIAQQSETKENKPLTVPESKEVENSLADKYVYSDLREAVHRLHRTGSGEIYLGLSLEAINQVVADYKLAKAKNKAEQAGNEAPLQRPQSAESLPEVKAWSDVTPRHIVKLPGYGDIKKNETITSVYIVDSKTGKIPVNRVTKNSEGPIYKREIDEAVQSLLSSVKERLSLPQVNALPYFWSGISVADSDLEIFLEAYPDAADLIILEGGKTKIPGERVAAFLAAKLHGITLESLLDEQHLMPPSAKEFALNPDVQNVWEEISKIYASMTADYGGEIRVFLKNNRASPNSVWSKREFPTLISNPNVYLITSVDSLTGKENVLFERSLLEPFLAAISTEPLFAETEGKEREGETRVAALGPVQPLPEELLQAASAGIPQSGWVQESNVHGAIIHRLRAVLTVLKVMNLVAQKSRPDETTRTA